MDTYHCMALRILTFSGSRVSAGEPLLPGPQSLPPPPPLARLYPLYLYPRLARPVSPFGPFQDPPPAPALCSTTSHSHDADNHHSTMTIRSGGEGAGVDRSRRLPVASSICVGNHTDGTGAHPRTPKGCVFTAPRAQGCITSGSQRAPIEVTLRSPTVQHPLPHAVFRCRSVPRPLHPHHSTPTHPYAPVAATAPIPVGPITISSRSCFPVPSKPARHSPAGPSRPPTVLPFPSPTGATIHLHPLTHPPMRPTPSTPFTPAPSLSHHGPGSHLNLERKR